MKSFVLIICFILIASIAFADVTAEILDYELDDNGNIRVKTQYKIDGIEVRSDYPKLNDKYYWVTRYSYKNFIGITDTEIKQTILSQIQNHAQNLIKQEFRKVQNKVIETNKLNGLIGTKIKEIEADIALDTDNDKILDKIWRVKTDGTKTIINYSPIPITE